MTLWALLYEDGLVFVKADSEEEATAHASNYVDKLGPFKEAITRDDLIARLESA
jgi:hypothetical protein